MTMTIKSFFRYLVPLFKKPRAPQSFSEETLGHCFHIAERHYEPEEALFRLALANYLLNQSNT